MLSTKSLSFAAVFALFSFIAEASKDKRDYAQDVIKTKWKTVTPTVIATTTVTDGAPGNSYSSSGASPDVGVDNVVNDKVFSSPHTPSSLTTSYYSTAAPSGKSSSGKSSSGKSSSGKSSSKAGLFSGTGTYYDVGLGACGSTSSNGELVCALNKPQYTESMKNSWQSSKCNDKIRIYYEGKTVDVTVVDQCPLCAHGSLDLSPAAFAALANQDLGRISITWDWI